MLFQGSWEKKLIEKIHNLRPKAKRPLDDAETPKAKRGRPKVSQVLTRYPPRNDTCDDDTALERSKQFIAKELEKERPRKDVVLTLARQTYMDRWAAILSECDTSASQFIEDFKELKKPYVVCKIVWWVQDSMMCFIVHVSLKVSFVLSVLNIYTDIM